MRPLEKEFPSWARRQIAESWTDKHIPLTTPECLKKSARDLQRTVQHLASTGRYSGIPTSVRTATRSSAGVKAAQGAQGRAGGYRAGLIAYSTVAKGVSKFYLFQSTPAWKRCGRKLCCNINDPLPCLAWIVLPSLTPLNLGPFCLLTCCCTVGTWCTVFNIQNTGVLWKKSTTNLLAFYKIQNK